MVDVVLLGVRRNDQQRLTRAVTTTSYNSVCRGYTARAGASQVVIRCGGLVDDRIHYVVIPAIGVVIHNYDRGALPLWSGLQAVDDIHHKTLFVELIRVPWMSIVHTLGFQVANRRKLPIGYSSPEIREVILMISQLVLWCADDQSVRGTHVVLVGSLREIQEGFVMRNIVRCGAG